MLYGVQQIKLEKLIVINWRSRDRCELSWDTEDATFFLDTLISWYIFMFIIKQKIVENDCKTTINQVMTSIVTDLFGGSQNGKQSANGRTGSRRRVTSDKEKETREQMTTMNVKYFKTILVTLNVVSTGWITIINLEIAENDIITNDNKSKLRKNPKAK